MSLRRDNRGVTRTSRPISARVRILAAILAVACIGLAIVGQRDLPGAARAGHRRGATIACTRRWTGCTTVAGDGADGADADDSGRPTASEDLDIDDYASVEEYLQGRRRAPRPGAQRGVRRDHRRRRRATAPRRCRASTSPTNEQLIERVDRRDRPTARRSIGTAVTDQGSLRYIAIPVDDARRDRRPASTCAPSISAPSSSPVTAAIDHLLDRGDRRAGRDRRRRLVRRRAPAVADPRTCATPRTPSPSATCRRVSRRRATTTSPT